MEILLLLCEVGLLSYYATRSRSQYKPFLHADPSSRLRFFYNKLIAATLAFSVSGLIFLFILTRRVDFAKVPNQFMPVFGQIGATDPVQDYKTLDWNVLPIGLLLIVGLSALIELITVFTKRKRPLALGNTSALIPRNAREVIPVILLCLNAGFGEELFFRLQLPLLITQLGATALFAIAVSIVAFGLVHAYQGVKGVVATALMAVVFFQLYLTSGSITLVMVTHALLNINFLLIRPLFGLALRRVAVRQAQVTS